MHSLISNSCDKAFFSLRVSPTKPQSFGSSYTHQQAGVSIVLPWTTSTAGVSCSGNSALLLFASLGCPNRTIPYLSEVSRGNL